MVNTCIIRAHWYLFFIMCASTQIRNTIYRIALKIYKQENQWRWASCWHFWASNSSSENEEVAQTRWALCSLHFWRYFILYAKIHSLLRKPDIHQFEHLLLSFHRPANSPYLQWFSVALHRVSSLLFWQQRVVVFYFNYQPLASCQFKTRNLISR